MTPNEIIRAKQDAYAIIERLPHFHLVNPAHIAKWVDAMALREPERLTWHAMRQGGFSGSEVGTLVQNLRGERAHFGSARKLVMQKLFLITPDKPNSHMLRGIQTEDLHRVKFMEAWNATRDEAAFAALSTGRGKYEFLRYSPDDVVTIQGRRVLVDYKSPSDVDDEGAFDIDYQCQINLGADILQHIGMPADNGLLSRLSWKEWRCVANWVPLDRNLQQEILASAHHYWTKFVLRGDVPAQLNLEKPAEYSDDLKKRLTVMSASIVALDEVASQIKKQREALDKEMKLEVEKSGATGKASVFSHAIKTEEEVNVAHLTDLLQTNHLDAEAEIAAMSDITKIDHKALIGDLQETGVNLRALVPEDVMNLPDVIERLEEAHMTFDSLSDLVAVVTAGGVSLESYAADKAVNMDRMKSRLEELSLPVDGVIDTKYSVKKSIAKKEDVTAFKPQFVAIGTELTKRLVQEAEGTMEYKLVRAEQVNTIADPTIVLASGQVLQITQEDMGDENEEGDLDSMVM